MSMIMEFHAVTADESARIRSLDTESFVEWLEETGGRRVFDLDKAWHAVHFTLVGDAWSTDGPYGQAVLGGEPFGEEIAYGPARWLSVEAVAALAAQLANLTPEQFEARLDFDALDENEIYPSIWDRDPDAEDLVEYVRQSYAQLRDQFVDAAGAGQGFIVLMT